MKKILINDIEQIDDFDSFIDGKVKGVIALATPMMNIFDWKNTLSYAAGEDESEIESVIYYAAVVVDEPGESGLERGTILSVKEYETFKHKFEGIKGKRGAEGIECLVSQIKINEKYSEMRKIEQECMAALEEMDSRLAENQEEYTEEDRDKRLDVIYRLRKARKTIDALYYLKKKKGRLAVHEISLFPLQIRSLISEGRSKKFYQIYELQKLYESVIMQNNRLRKLLEIEAPEIIIINESRMLQERIDCLYANGRRGKAKCSIPDDQRSALCSLTEILMQNILS